MKTIQQTLTEIRDQFRAANLDTPELDARLLVQAALGVTHETLLLDSSRLITTSEAKKLTEMASRRMLREPVSHIVGKRNFWRSEFNVSRETLDPRADSETIIEEVLRFTKGETVSSILDLGTGTGCLLLSLLQEFPQATGMGVDISAGAIEVAERNAAALQLTDRAVFKNTDWSKMTIDKPFDVVISNPPYIAETEIPLLEPEVREYDPLVALAGGADGLDCYREIAALLPRLLTKTGYVFLEIGHTQAVSVKEILAGQGFRVLQVAADLGGRDRCVVAQRADSG